MKATTAPCGCVIVKTDNPVTLGGTMESKKPVMEVIVQKCKACQEYTNRRTALVKPAEIHADDVFKGKTPAAEWAACFFRFIDHAMSEPPMRVS